MNFFWTKDEYKSWININEMNDDEDIYCLDILEALDVAYKIFKL
ncbi:hypothetical protein J2Z43_000158 [Clostridioides mangenotii]|jgi:hypothetical protein|uniref:Phage protein n=2 Tax=Metaclostridioides mangenotii TaxID=1540 RepID=A0ABS4E767_9FIRM|nr:hypothetical protein [Clostridioides mangenotii]